MVTFISELEICGSRKTHQLSRSNNGTSVIVKYMTRLSVILLSVVVKCIIMPSVVMLSVVMLSVVMLSVIVKAKM